MRASAVLTDEQVRERLQAIEKTPEYRAKLRAALLTDDILAASPFLSRSSESPLRTAERVTQSDKGGSLVGPRNQKTGPRANARPCAPRRHAGNSLLLFADALPATSRNSRRAAENKQSSFDCFPCLCNR